MKVADVFTLFHKSSFPSSSSIQGDGIKPVSIIDKMSLQPGQLLRGEVLGEDGKGNLLLKVGDEIISTRSLVSMTTGQQVWVEVKDVGDSLLFSLAQAKGAVHELLKNIMEVRPVVLAQGKDGAVVSPEFQKAPALVTEISFVPTLTPIYEDGGLPQETIRLLKALIALPDTNIPLLPEPKMQQLVPFLSVDTGQVDLGRVITFLSQTGKVPAVLSELEPMRPLFVFGGDIGAELEVEFISHQEKSAVAGRVDSGSPVFSGEDESIPFITHDGQVVTHAVQVVRALVESATALQSPDVLSDNQVAESLSKSFMDLGKSVLGAGKIPDSLHRFEPIRQLLQSGTLSLARNSGALPAVTADELIQGFARTSIQGQSLSPELYNETVAKILSGLQGAEPRPELLRVLKQLVSSFQSVAASEGECPGGDEHLAKQSDVATGVAKAASFFKSQAVVNQEVAHVIQGDCVLVPCFFAGQSGWGEWLWSHEQKQEQGQQTSENLAFFLEMSNLGPISIQAILGQQSLAGQFRVADDTAHDLIVQGLPVFEERLKALGYDAHFTCQQKPVAVMQEIKNSLERRISDSTPASLVDIQA